MTDDASKRTNDHAEVELLNGVLVYSYKAGAFVDLAAARGTTALGTELVTGPVPTLVRMKEVTQVSHAAREFFAHDPANIGISAAAALVIGSPVSHIIGNFFLGLNRPNCPTRLFDDEVLALAWLEQFKATDKARESV